MYEPHLVNHANDHTHDENSSSTNILDELDKIAPIKSFDAFPKVPPPSSRPLSLGAIYLH